MVARFKDVLVRVIPHKIVVYSGGNRYIFADVDENGNPIDFRHLISQFIKDVDDYTIPTLIPDKSTPMSPDSDGNSYGYGPSDEEAWLSYYSTF